MNADEPAFPSNKVRNRDCDWGLTKREYFAALAMQAWVSRAAFNNEADAMLRKCGIKTEDTERFIAGLCCSMADALLAELAKEKS